MSSSPEEELRRVNALYVRGVDKKDTEGIIALFEKDALLSIRGVESRGHEAIRAFLSDLFSVGLAETNTLHLVSNHIIDIQENTAAVSTDLLVLRSKESGKWLDGALVNTHEDRLRRGPNGWQFVEKIVRSI